MTDRAFSAHPMLEPADYALTPELAKERLSGAPLTVYRLLWHAAVATLQDGPAIRRQTSVLGFAAPHCGRPAGFEIHIQHDLVESAGWACNALAAELDRLAPQRASAASLPLQQWIARVPTQLIDGGWRVRSAPALAHLARTLPAPASSDFKVVARRPQDLSMDVLLQQMSEHHVGRPSTYAGAIERALDGDLIHDRGGLAVGKKGAQLLALLAPHGNAFSAQACEDLGNDLADVETGMLDAGEVLNKHTQRMLGMTPALTGWLSNLAIEGETLEQAMDRMASKPPRADGWSGVDLPAGICPTTHLADHGAALALREELDSRLCGPDPQAWRAAGHRGRALARLAALCWMAHGPARPRLRRLLRHGNRDLAWRWWIDLAPSERPISWPELIAAMRKQRDGWSQQHPLCLLERLIKALG